MPKLNYIIFCDKAFVSNEGTKENPVEKINIKGIFETIHSRSFPVVHYSMAIIVKVDIGDLKKGVEYSEIAKIERNGREIIKAESRFKKNAERHMFVHNLSNVLFPAKGEYKLTIFINGKSIGSTSLLLKKIL